MSILEMIESHKYRRAIFLSTLPQQVFINRAVSVGLHNTTDISFCETMLGHYEGLLQSVIDGTHISLLGDLEPIIDDKEDFKRHLIQLYKTDILRFRSNLLNLIHSEN